MARICELTYIVIRGGWRQVWNFDLGMQYLTKIQQISQREYSISL